MKKFVLGLVWLAGAYTNVLAQTNIDAMEYFFDSDPGVGNGISIPITTSASQNLNLNINTSSLAIGFHRLTFRAKHQSGSWGIQDSRTIYVASESVATTAILDEMEYYFDSDPGPGNGTPISFTAAASVNILPSLPMTSLATGFHALHIRGKDDNGNWGIPEIRTFYIVQSNVATQADVVQLEYFFDSEPGYGSGTPLSVTSGSQINLAALISSASLSTGFHTIYIRAKDNDNQWGFAEQRTFYLDPFTQVSSIEWYIDTDPGEGSATNIAVTPGGDIDLDFTIPTASLAGGNHTLGVRAARTDGSWGNTSTTSFDVQETQTITFTSLAAATYGDPPFTLSGTSSSGLAVSYSSSNPLVATISENTVTITGAGTTVITASQAGDPGYAAAPDVTQSLLVNKADQSITFGALALKGASDPAFTLNATSSSSLNISYSSSNLAVATISGNTVTIVAPGTTDITASQTGDGNYNPASDIVQTLTVLPENNAPSISVQAGVVFFINDPVSLNTSIAITDPEDVLASATVSITSGLQATEDQLLFEVPSGINGTFNASTGVLSFIGAASVADYESVLSSVQYNNTSPTPNTSDRSISIEVNDGTNASNAVVVTVTINKPPAITAAPRDLSAGGNFVFFLDDILSDPDDNLDLSTLSIVSKQGAQITVSGNVVTVNYSLLPDYEGTDELTISVCDQGGKCETQIVAVEVAADVEIFNGISANTDNINDFLKVKFLPPGSGVTIFNRWGDPVYENAEYDTNDPAKRFEGYNTDGKPLATGTYFYLVNLPDGRKRSGYLQLKR